MKKQFKKIIITGACGFIGSHLAELMANKCKTLILIDNLSRGKISNVQHILDKYKNVQFYKFDLRSESKKINALFSQADLVFNLAALNTGVDYDKGRTQEMFEENILLQLIPLRIAAKEKVKKFIQISSASIYSKTAMEKKIPTPESSDSGEPEESKIGYALAKKMGERLAQWYAKNTHIHTIRVRFINVFGERDHSDDKGHFIPVMIRKIVQAKKTLEVFGSGNQKRSFLYVKDAVDALFFLAQNGANGEVYNVDSGSEKKVRDIVFQLQNILHKDNLQINFNTLKPEGSKRRLLDTTKLRSLGWKPNYSFDQGLLHTVEDVKKNI